MDGNKTVTALFNRPAPPPDGDLDHDGIPNGIDTDIDGDGFSNDQEITVGTDPYDAISKPNLGLPPNPTDPDGDFDGDLVMNIDDIDDDNDSISDIQEIADDTSPFDATSHRIIPLPMIVSKMSAGVKYTSANNDGLSISGFIPNVKAGFKPAGTQISFNIAGAQTTTFTLDGKGRAKSSAGQLTLKSKAMKINKATKELVLLVDGNISFTLKYKGALGADWIDDGVTGNKKNAPISILIDMTLDGAPYSTTITALVNSNDKGGKVKK